MDSDSEEMLIQAVGKKPDDVWIATHLWGFEEVYGESKHSCRVKVTGSDGQKIELWMVDDYEGE